MIRLSVVLSWPQKLSHHIENHMGMNTMLWLTVKHKIAWQAFLTGVILVSQEMVLVICISIKAVLLLSKHYISVKEIKSDFKQMCWLLVTTMLMRRSFGIV